jgi:hypothetical protein
MQGTANQLNLFWLRQIAVLFPESKSSHCCSQLLGISKSYQYMILTNRRRLPGRHQVQLALYIQHSPSGLFLGPTSHLHFPRYLGQVLYLSICFQSAVLVYWFLYAVYSNDRLMVAMLIPQVRPAHKYPNSPWEMIHPPGGDNAVCM